ncbi:MAG: hypothetical protein LBE12_01935 [Planctomycetaceae bacterium]|nr:hypothetical protein [Planctomycetaceae bacterium]
MWHSQFSTFHYQLSTISLPLQGDVALSYSPPRCGGLLCSAPLGRRKKHILDPEKLKK